MIFSSIQAPYLQVGFYGDAIAAMEPVSSNRGVFRKRVTNVHGA
jgi:hypothetical protein